MRLNVGIEKESNVTGSCYEDLRKILLILDAAFAKA